MVMNKYLDCVEQVVIISEHDASLRRLRGTAKGATLPSDRPRLAPVTRHMIRVSM